MRRAPISPDGQSSALSELDSLNEEIKALEGLDLDLLRRRWRSLMGRPAPAYLARGLLLRILAYQHQIARLGDLDRETRAALGTATHDSRRAEIAAATSLDGGCRGLDIKAAQKSVVPRPGTVLERESNGVLHRVTVTKEGCVWNGKSFRSLSDAARAITGTKWSGPRFFGLRSSNRATANAGNEAAP